MEERIYYMKDGKLESFVETATEANRAYSSALQTFTSALKIGSFETPFEEQFHWERILSHEGLSTI